KIQLQLFGKMAEGSAMVGRKTKLPDSPSVSGRGISLVPIPFIMRKLGVKRTHVIVPVGFRQHRGGSNRIIQTVALYNARVRNFPVFPETVSVDDQVLHLAG